MVKPELTSYQLLLIEDNPGDAELAAEWLHDMEDFNLELTRADTLASAVDAVIQRDFDGAILDLNLPDSKGIETLRRLLEASPDLPVIVFSGLEVIPDFALEIERSGAADVLFKNDTPSRQLAHSVRSVLRRTSSERLHKQFRTLLTAIPDAVIVTDREGAVEFMNPAGHKLFGAKHGDVLSERINFAISEGEAVEIEILNGGEMRSAEMRVVECTWNRKPAYLAMMRDVTEHKQLADQLRQSQKMEALGLLAGGIAHDFNNLLLVIQLYTDIIRKSRGSDLFSAEMAEIANAVERARSMTRHLLTFSRQQPTELSVLDAADIVEDVYSMLRRTLPANIEISTLIAEDLHPILVDRGQMEQVLMNLAINARDAMPEGGRFTISLENATVKAGSVTLEPGDYVQMRVSDTGSGIAAEHLPRIFEPFFTTKPRGQGTGLGLANCYAIIVQAGGQISVESTVGAGTGFLILLPCTKHVVENDADGADGVAEADDAGSETILVVEDDQAVSRATCRILESSGYKVLCAANGDEAKRTLERDGVGIDMVLSDVVMPQLGGTELAEYIASHFPYLPIVFMTGYSDHPIAQQDGAMTIGGHPAILKPFQPHDLTGLVREALDRRVSRAAS